MIQETFRLSTNNSQLSTTRYTYGYLDKVLKVDRDGQSAQFHYGADGMLLGKTKNGHTESWTWDGLALLSRGDETYVNEPHLTGGVPIIASRPKMKQTALGATKVEGDEADEILLSDYLGTTLDTLDTQDTEPTSSLSPPPSSLNSTGLLTSYGGNSSSGLESSSLPSSVSSRFTGKPYDADLGAHVFPFRNYRSDTGGWTTADPSGFPDGPNQHYYAPVATSGVDPLGLAGQLVGSPTKTGDRWFAVAEGSMTLTWTWTESWTKGSSAWKDIYVSVGAPFSGGISASIGTIINLFSPGSYGGGQPMLTTIGDDPLNGGPPAPEGATDVHWEGDAHETSQRPNNLAATYSNYSNYLNSTSITQHQLGYTANPPNVAVNEQAVFDSVVEQPIGFAVKWDIQTAQQRDGTTTYSIIWRRQFFGSSCILVGFFQAMERLSLPRKNRTRMRS